ncbi:hypothetical protein COCC4DRAFT_148410 [Bipolaris maydis ATCC 48331]|uniref:Uncharacterized protein n=2 Tax=Cochliobolus heterostrophus TaxID=5016 RepID=M2U9Y0_COCH5|nr:uncharacterized protein COCC4DRAFT_148410 [Bipolaris maydis ATCC 48331]EMD84762.1 hypothetical protein COCHEDRAFT_1121625 [Bipolaris maydis C5]KAH7558020.1 hypothetical protein BM1_05292 [Bipolaris maydis]EMD97433.1 hypothetical protein COCHEDRAFT_1084411 [Bipolaris maydis C5]ENI01429.1 hypothetical protein COCC4DRAFT_148410 [Bipolaris maydis ATCC 48331]KAJ5031115.1 hypothetical protein J3E73DRAFT_252117 [Bipolaris maydis]
MLFLPTLLLTSTLASPLPFSNSCTPTNLVQNPSFESNPSDLSPWLSLATGSFSSRTLSRDNPGGHNSATAYIASCNSSADILSTLTLSQSYIEVAGGKTVECYAWARAGKGGKGGARVEVFLDGTSCGGVVEVGEGQEEWVKVGGRVVVQDVGAGGVGHTVAVTVQGYGAEGDGGWSIAIDDVGVGVGC